MVEALAATLKLALSDAEAEAAEALTEALTLIEADVVSDGETSAWGEADALTDGEPDALTEAGNGEVDALMDWLPELDKEESDERVA